MIMDVLLIAQIASMTLALGGTYLTASTKPRIRVYGFTCLLLANAPAGYVNYSAGLWVYMAIIPIWMLIESKGIYNNTRSALKRELEKMDPEEAIEVINNKPS